MQIVRSLPEDIWRNFVDQHPQSNIFHTPEMFQVFVESRGYQPTLWAVIDPAGQVQVLFLPVQVTTIGGPLRRLTTRAVAYGSVLPQLAAPGQAALQKLLAVYVQQAKREALFTELRNLADLGEIQPLLEGCGFVYEAHLNYLVDLARSPETIMQGIGKRTRKQIRQALRQNQVIIEDLTTREQLAAWYKVLQQTYNQARVPLADRSLFEAAFDILSPQKMIKFSAARVGQVYAAVSVELLYKDIIYGWYGGVDRAYQNLYPNELLTWHILEWGAQHGYKLYDFGGAGKPDEKYGVRDFKAKFGGELVCFGRNSCVHAPLLLKLSTRGYDLYRRSLNRA